MNFSEKLPMSVVVITLNEEKNLERCLRSAPFCSEWVVLDSFSQDKTVSVARSLGANVFEEKWRGFGPQKRRAVELARHDWVLSLDGDEALSPELQKEIVENFSKLDPKVGYLLPRKSYHLGRWITHGGWYPDYQLKLFNKKYSNYNEAPIHEKVESPSTGNFREPVLHWVFDSMADQVATNNRYSSLQAEKLVKEDHQKFSLSKLLTKPVTKFVETYFLKKGFLDGLPGFLIAVSAAYSVFLKWAKIWEMEKLVSRNSS